MTARIFLSFLCLLVLLRIDPGVFIFICATKVQTLYDYANHVLNILLLKYKSEVFPSDGFYQAAKLMEVLHISASDGLEAVVVDVA